MTSHPAIRAVVLDMQPIDPPIGGGRLRVLGIYHALGFPTTYIGTYDWPGPAERRHHLSETLEEVDIPLSAAHFQVNEQWQGYNFGRTLIDAAFPLMAQLSTDFVHAVTAGAREADILVFSHPWVYPIVRDAIDDDRQLLVYDAQNFEGLLRAELLDDGAFGSEIVKHVIATEYELARRVDVILTCAEADAELFRTLYGVKSERLQNAPNGVFCELVRPAGDAERGAARRSLGLTGPTAIFLASAFRPNVDAVHFICEKLAPALPDVTFVVCGGVCDSPELSELRSHAFRNVRVAGLLTDDQKIEYLRAAELAINPVFAGSGSNVKMFEFAAAGLPIVTTPVGARGIDSDALGLVVEAKEFDSTISALLSDARKREELGLHARRVVERQYAWEKISPRVGQMLAGRLAEKLGAGGRGPEVRMQGTPVARTDASTDEPSVAARANAGTGEFPVGRIAAPPPFALVTTWGIRCGIAENSRHLCTELEKLGAECHILGNVLEDELEVANESSHTRPVERVWRYRERPGEAIAEACRRHGLQRLWIQYHTAFFDVEALHDLIARASQAGLSPTVTLHDTGGMSVESLRGLAGLQATFVVHDERERKRLEQLGLRQVAHIPLGALDLLADREDGGPARGESGTTIGTFGFLRPHKGVRELIEAIGILTPLFPSVRLLALTATYSADESNPYLEQCQSAVRELRLEDRIRIRTDFLPLGEIIGSLRGCAVVVLPYRRTNEGASAAAQIAVAARRPVIVTRQPMFRSLAGVTYPVEGEAPPVLAAGIATLLKSPMLQANLSSGADRYVRCNSFQGVARRYADLLSSVGATQ